MVAQYEVCFHYTIVVPVGNFNTIWATIYTYTFTSRAAIFVPHHISVRLHELYPGFNVAGQLLVYYLSGSNVLIISSTRKYAVARINTFHESRKKAFQTAANQQILRQRLKNETE